MNVVHVRDSLDFRTGMPLKIFDATATATSIAIGARGQVRKLVEPHA